MAVLYLDESGGLDPGHFEVFVVAGVIIHPTDAKRVVRRFRKDKGSSQSELKGSLMSDALQRYLLHGVLSHEHVSCAAAVVDTNMAHAMWGRNVRGEHQVYAALVAELLAALPVGGCNVLADGGRYTGTLMKQLPSAIAACSQLLAQGANGLAAPLSVTRFADSEQYEGLQIADVLGNFVYRACRSAFQAAAGQPVNGMLPPPVTVLNAQYQVRVVHATLGGLGLPAWLAATPVVSACPTGIPV
jgi:hypothetical protein